MRGAAPPRPGAGGARPHRRPGGVASRRAPVLRWPPPIARPLSENLGRLRSYVRLLCHPADARQAPLRTARRAGARGTTARGPGRTRDQPRRAGSRSLGPGHGPRGSQVARFARDVVARNNGAVVSPALRLLGWNQSAACRPDGTRAAHRALYRYADPARERPHARADATSGAPAHAAREARLVAWRDPRSGNPHDLPRGIPR